MQNEQFPIGKQRVQYIDILKGIGIILVVLGHITMNSKLFSFIYAFHMPLFFVVSGMFLHDSPSFILNQAKKLLIPYFSFGFLTFAYWAVFEIRFRELPEGETVLSQFLNLFYPRVEQISNVVLWFLPCLFFSSIMANLINRFIKSEVPKYCVIVGLVAFVGFVKDDSLPYFFGQALQALPYIMIGNVFLKKIILFNNLIVKIPFLSIFVSILGLILVYFSGVSCNMLAGSFNPFYVLSFLIAICGFISVYLIAFFIKSNLILSWLGRNSLIIMLIHEPIKRIVLKIYSVILDMPIDVIRGSITKCLIMTILTLLIVGFLVYIIKHYAPWLLGRKGVSLYTEKFEGLNCFF